jgi:hypothetical protein
MFYKQIKWAWDLLGKTPRYRVEKHISSAGFGPKYLYRVYDCFKSEFIFDGPLNSVINFLKKHEPLNPWLFKESK